MTLSIEKIPLFHGLSKEDLNAIRGCLREKEYENREILFSEGAGCERIFIVNSGRVKLYRTASNGREQILETLGSGDTCACNPGNAAWHCSSTAEAIGPCRVWFLSRDDYIRLVRTNSKLAQMLNEIFAKRLQCFTGLIEEISLKDAKKRLIKFLLDMLNAKKKGVKKNDILFIPFTREEIAQRLGMARETVARYLTQLKEAGWIDIKPHQIEVKDKEGLETQLH